MTTEPIGLDPYEAVLRDLRAKRDALNATIAMIESVRGGVPGGLATPPISTARVEEPRQSGGAIDAGAFFGMTIYEATKKLLQIKRRQLTNPEIVEGLRAGGLVLGSKDAANTVGSVLNRAEAEGEIVRLSPGRGGKWGLTEWTPHLRRRNGQKETEAETQKDTVRDPFQSNELLKEVLD